MDNSQLVKVKVGGVDFEVKKELLLKCGLFRGIFEDTYHVSLYFEFDDKDPDHFNEILKYLEFPGYPLSDECMIDYDYYLVDDIPYICDKCAFQRTIRECKTCDYIYRLLYHTESYLRMWNQKKGGGIPKKIFKALESCHDYWGGEHDDTSRVIQQTKDIHNVISFVPIIEWLKIGSENVAQKEKERMKVQVKVEHFYYWNYWIPYHDLAKIIFDLPYLQTLHLEKNYPFSVYDNSLLPTDLKLNTGVCDCDSCSKRT